jgi:HEPN domain-containing protein
VLSIGYCVNTNKLLIFDKKLTKKDHITYWLQTAMRDWRTVNNLLKTREYVPALFWAHLMLEKLFNAHWVKDNETNHPPKIHNLITLSGRTKLALSDDDLEFLVVMNQFQLEGRYPDYVQAIWKSYKGKETKKVIDRVNKIRKCLLKGLQ